jgi:hypothetical protein
LNTYYLNTASEIRLLQQKFWQIRYSIKPVIYAYSRE